jgi:hypothetical protein
MTWAPYPLRNDLGAPTLCVMTWAPYPLRNDLGALPFALGHGCPTPGPVQFKAVILRDRSEAKGVEGPASAFHRFERARFAAANRAANAAKSTRALQAAEKLDPEGRGGFNPRIKPTGSTRALAPEGRLSPISHEIPSSSAASSTPTAAWGAA